MPHFEVVGKSGARAVVKADQPPDEKTRAALEDLVDAAAARMKAIDTCHERVACPKCGAQVGQRCHRARASRTRGATPALKNPHEARWRQEVPPR